MVRFGLSAWLLLSIPLVIGLSGPSGKAAASLNEVKYLVAPNALPGTNGIRFDPKKKDLVIAQLLYNRVQRMDLRSRSLVPIVDGLEKPTLKFPDDVAIDGDGYLYFTEIFERTVTRTDPNGDNPEVLARGISDGRTFPNGIAFDHKGRLFVTDMNFQPDHPGGLWQIDLNGGPARPIVRGIPTANAFDFGPDNKAYIPSMWDGINGGGKGSIYVVDVDAPVPTATPFARGFGVLTALKVDAHGRLVVTEADTGRVWRINRADPGRPRLLAQGAPGLDNLAIDSEGTIYVSSFLTGNVSRVDEESGKLVPLLPHGPLSLPVSLNQAPDGSILVGDVMAITSIGSHGAARTLYRPLLNEKMLVSPSAVWIGKDLFFTEFVPFRTARICKLIQTNEGPRCHRLIDKGLVSPWHLRHIHVDRHDFLLVADQGAGTVLQIDPQSGESTLIAAGLSGPTGLAYDSTSDLVYVSESREGQVRAIDRASGLPVQFFRDLKEPEGVAVSGQALLVVESGTGTLTRVDLVSDKRTPLAEGLPTRTADLLPQLFVFTADVTVRSNGNIVISGPGDGSLTELVRR